MRDVYKCYGKNKKEKEESEFLVWNMAANLLWWKTSLSMRHMNKILKKGVIPISATSIQARNW